jgi:asparagine synthetase B (glutamine-hydrolysing)
MLKTFFESSFIPKEQIYRNINWNNIYLPVVYKKWIEEKFKETLIASNWNLVQSSIYFDLFYNTSWNNYLLKTDRASMSQSLENRSPFCNNKRIERSSRCPTKRKATYKNSKVLFKEINKWILPNEIINRKKKWFQPPIIERFTKNNYNIQSKDFFQYMIKQGIISEKWGNFFQKNVFNNGNDKKYIHYLIRIFLLKQRYNTRIKE